jgi:C4-dicarboxylate transporter DctM subunit
MESFIIIIVVFLGLMVLGAPVFLSMGMSGFIGLLLLKGPIALLDLPIIAYQGIDNFTLVAVPLFVLTGTIMEASRSSHYLFEFATKLVGSFPNALGVSTVAACAIFSAISGSSVATAATIGLIALASLAREGYPEHVRGSLLAAGGTLGILIPPSISMILFGVITEQSVGKLFMAGLIPGIILASLFAIYLMVWVKPKIRGEAYAWSEKWHSFKKAFWILLLPVIILGGIYSGLATPTEVAGASVVYVTAIGFLVYRTLSVRILREACLRAVLPSTMIMMLISFGTVLTRYMTIARVPQKLSEMVTFFGTSPVLIITGMLLVYLILGTFLEATSMILITVPIFYPVANALGIDMLFFGVFVTVCMELAQITPPVGINLYVISGVGNLKLESVIKGVLPYIIIMIVLIYLLWFIPPLTLWLPNTMN